MSHSPPRPTSTRQLREQRQGHRAQVLWFTGLSGAGKSTLAELVEERLSATGMRTYRLDGDALRAGLSRDLGFSESDRRENIRRAAEVAKLLFDAGLVVLASFISPHRSERARVRALVGGEHFLEIYVNCPLDICEQRDRKGLYRQARTGAIADFSGLASPYEPPEHPDVEVRTDQLDEEACAERILQAALPRLQLNPHGHG